MDVVRVCIHDSHAQLLVDSLCLDDGVLGSAEDVYMALCVRVCCVYNPGGGGLYKKPGGPTKVQHKTLTIYIPIPPS